jgi:hypothetical protein
VRSDDACDRGAPTGATHDTSDSSDPFYIGVKPTVTTAPKVIDAVIQQ